MKSHVFLVGIVISLLFISCSPSIGRSIIKTYPPAPENELVYVYYEKNEIPEKAEVLGTVNIKDGGLTTNCDYYTILDILKSETRKAGGNAVYLRQVIPPSFQSTCYQMNGVLLYIGDNKFSNDSIRGVDYSYLSRPVTANLNARELPKFKINLNAGYGRRLNRLSDDLTDFGKHYMRKLMSGFSFDAAFEFYFNDTGGFGVTYRRYQAKADEWGTDLKTFEQGTITTRHAINMVAPYYVLRSNFSQSFFIDLKMGLGYMNHISKENFLKDDIKLIGHTVGLYWGVGLEYKMSDLIGIGLNAGFMTGSIGTFNIYQNGRVHTEKLPEGVREGLFTGDISLGLRFYFK